jgi:hypothetical protein
MTENLLTRFWSAHLEHRVCFGENVPCTIEADGDGIRTRVALASLAAS